MSIITSASISRHEFGIVIAVVAAFLIICFSTTYRFPIVSDDEVYFAEPAVNANLGLGFTSYRNAVQAHGRFWAGNVPLYSIFLTGWLKVFGIGLAQVRSFGYVLAALALAILWWAISRLRLIASSGMRIAFLLTLLLAYGPSASFRAFRYDTLSVLMVALTLLAASISSTRLRLASLVGLGMLYMPTQISLVSYAAEIAVLLLCFYGRRYFREVVALGIGTILGGAVLYFFLQSQGVWSDFMLFIQHQRRMPGGFPKDPSLLLILAAACCLTLDQYRRGDFNWRSPLVFGLVAGVCVPIGQLAYGWFVTTYTWMAILPLAGGIFSEFSRTGSVVYPFRRNTAVVALTASALLGMPLQLVSTVRFWQERDYGRVVSLVHGQVNKQDWLCCDAAAYYAAKAAAETVFLTGYDDGNRFFTPQERRHISIMVVSPSEFERWRKRLGGAWVPTGEPVRPPTEDSLFFRGKFWGRLFANYDLQVYRRNRDEAEGLYQYSEAK